jgi:hypothetical protein
MGLVVANEEKKKMAGTGCGDTHPKGMTENKAAACTKKVELVSIASTCASVSKNCAAIQANQPTSEGVHLIHLPLVWSSTTVKILRSRCRARYR